MSDVRFTAKMRGTADVVRLLKQFPQKIRRTLESLVKQEARGLAVKLVRAAFQHSRGRNCAATNGTNRGFSSRPFS